MSLSTSTRLGPYEIIAPLGAGGMGQVYRARDTRLGREVAIKVLAPDVANDPDRRARLEREAQAVAALSHPNILALFDIGLERDQLYVVTELLEGETLADRLAEGPLPIRRAVEIAIATARGLAAAHGKAIAHRDLKPANVFLLADGHVKILDFGLARATGTAAVDATATRAALTDPGTVLGTAGYMAPEQVRGQPVDGRADIFALGVLLHEMLSGQRTFVRDSAVETLNAILKEDAADLLSTRADVPPALDRIVRHCLEKNPAQRFQSAQDVVFALEMLPATSSGVASIGAAVPSSGPQPAMPAARASRRIGALAGWAVAAVAVIAALASASWRASAPPPALPTFAAIGAPHGRFAEHPSPAVSPDGKRLVFWAPDRDGVIKLFVRDLDNPTARAVPGTEVATSYHQPSFSPDGREVLLFLDLKLKRVAIDGGAPQTIADAPQPRGASWSAAGQVLYVPTVGGPLHLVSSGGGASTPLPHAMPPDARRGGPRHPYWLPGGKHFLFSDLARIFVASVDGGTPRLLVEAASRAEYVAGHLLYVSEGSLVARPFDAAAMTFTGDAVRLADGVGMTFSSVVDAAFSASAAGTIVHWAGLMIPPSELVWIDRAGQRVGVAGPRGHFNTLSATPGFTHLAVERITEARAMETEVIELSRGVVTRVTLDSVDRVAAITPVYSRDGRHLFLFGAPGVYRAGPQGQSPSPVHPGMAWLSDVSPDGRWLLYSSATDAATWGISALPLAGGEPQPYVKTRRVSRLAQFSPDGAWVAFDQDEGARSEIFVDAFPTRGDLQRVSIDGGQWPRWNHDGRRLYFIAPDNGFMEVEVTRAADGLRFSRPTRLFRAPAVNDARERTQYLLSPDGQRFLFNARIDDALPRTLDLVLNWTALLRK